MAGGRGHRADTASAHGPRRPGRPAAPPADAADADEGEDAGELPFIDFDAPAGPGHGGRAAADPSRFGEVSLDEGTVDFGPGVSDDDEPDK